MNTRNLMCVAALVGAVLAPLAGASPGVGVAADLSRNCQTEGPTFDSDDLRPWRFPFRVVVGDDCALYVEYRVESVSAACGGFDTRDHLPPGSPEPRARVQRDCFVLVNA